MSNNKENKKANKKEIIGKTSATAKESNTTGEFYFWIKDGVRINPFDFVIVEHFDSSYTVGQVDEIYSYTDAESHLTNYIGSELGKPDAQPLINRLKIMVAKAVVLANIRNDNSAELLMPIPSDRPVYFADEKAIATALGFDDKDVFGKKIPAGLLEQSNGEKFVVYLDSYYIIGPESAHVNITGISGLAAKTSYAMFLIKSLYEKLDGNLAVIIFNVKHSDLLHLHECPNNLDESDKDMYKTLGLNTEPFPCSKIRYYLPRGPGGRPDSDNPPNNYTLYAYTLGDVYANLDLLLAEVQDPYYTLDAFTNYVRNNWENNRIKFRLRERTTYVRNWSELINLSDEFIGYTVYNEPKHKTPPRLKRELRRLTGYSIFVNNRENNEVYLGNSIREDIKNKRIIVIDIYRVPTINQPFIVGDIMRNIENLYREGILNNLDGLIIFIDELNTFAPNTETPNVITEHIIEIARKGRARKTALFGVQQFKSEVHSQVWGNCSLHVIGKLGSAELSTTPYRELTQQAKNTVLGLRQGEMLLHFKNWRSSIKVKFPKPYYRRLY